MARSGREPVLRIIVFQERDWLCAQCVDFNLAVQAKTLPQLYKAMYRMVAGHIAVRKRHGLLPFADLKPAPAKYRKMFDRSRIPLRPQTRPSVAGVALPPAAVRVAVPA